MKYFILCPYCNKIYIVDGENQISFTCPNCGASNKYEDVVHSEDDAEKIRQAAKELVRQQEELRGKEEAFLYLQKKQNENRPPSYFSNSDDDSSDSDTDSYESDADSSESDDDSYENNYTDSGDNTLKILSIFFIIIAVLFIIPWILAYEHSNKSKPPYASSQTDYDETLRKWKTQGNETSKASKIRDLMNDVSVAVSHGDASGLTDCLYGAENFDWISISDWESFFEEYYGEKWGNTLGFIEMTYNSGWPPPDNTYEYAYFSIDIEPYQIFDFKDTNGKVHTYTFYQNESGAWRLYLDYSGLVAPFCEEALLGTWNAVKNTALNYGDFSAIEKYFTDNITTDQLNELLRYVRFNLGEGEPYDNANLTKLTLTGSMDSQSCDKFNMKLTAEYQSQSSSHPEGSYTAKIRLEYRDSQWLISDLYDYEFFIIESLNSKSNTP